MDITKGIRHIEHEHGKTWIWLNFDNDFVPEFRGFVLLYHTIYEYPNGLTIAQPNEK